MPDLASNDRVFCVIHRDTEIVTEPGGPDMPTIHGRRYCPKCQTALTDAFNKAVT